MSSKSFEQKTVRMPYAYVRKINPNNHHKTIKKNPKNCDLTMKEQEKLLCNKSNRNNKTTKKFTKYPAPMEVDDPTEYALYRSWDPMDLD
ncbi:hypothetical protein RclHR1_01180014 [Rhizophagus clarus]|uniref:Uncharacterized protein n=1 Tax=Rhizophagus clarus TaxID=94130 RepID=A0A2Z6Q5D3_9GLOM|nr:hypothetical protein RclHR1_01180014 [Rhizophagus clarus]GES95472.1 hypothetical protein RCL_jg9760.t1 [Rhizophagus clarus]